MPSPFPGMDPYVEASLRTTLHHELSSRIAWQLTPLLRPKYVARTVERFVYEESSDVAVERADKYPDISITARGGDFGGPSGLATLTAPLCLPTVIPDPIPHVSVEIRRVDNRELVTGIEVLSPTNKTGRGRDEYLNKRCRIMASSAYLIEIDLLRGGARLPMRQPLPMAPYFVFVSRAERRPLVDIWPIWLADTLPEIPVPLLPGDSDVPLNLGDAFSTIYDGMAFDLDIDYSQPPNVPLDPDEIKWIDERLRAAGIR